MYQVSRIRHEKQNLYRIDFTSGEQFLLSEDAFVSGAIYKGKELSTDEFQQLKKQAALDLGYQQALHYLSYQLRSVKEVRDHLKEKGWQKKEIEPILEKLQRSQLLNDQVFSESYVRTLMRTSEKGPAVIVQQLKKKGISEEFIHQSLVLYTPECQLENALALAEKLLRKYQRLSHQEGIQKLKVQLRTKGYSPDLIRIVLEELHPEKNEEQEQEVLKKMGEKLWERHRNFPSSTRKQKVSQRLFRKGFAYDQIQQFITEREEIEYDE